MKNCMMLRMVLPNFMAVEIILKKQKKQQFHIRELELENNYHLALKHHLYCHERPHNKKVINTIKIDEKTKTNKKN
jgi:hypothetical protein